MKDAIVAIIALIAIIVGILFFTSDTFEQMTHPGQTKVMGMWVDDESIDKYRFSFKEIEAEWNGDTYCKKCDKYIPGKVRICTYCGQYVD